MQHQPSGWETLPSPSIVVCDGGRITPLLLFPLRAKEHDASLVYVWGKIHLHLDMRRRVSTFPLSLVSTAYLLYLRTTYPTQCLYKRGIHLSVS